MSDKSDIEELKIEVVKKIRFQKPPKHGKPTPVAALPRTYHRSISWWHAFLKVSAASFPVGSNTSVTSKLWDTKNWP